MSVDQDLLGFVREHIRSVWGLELLLLLKRDRERCWTPEELVRELRGSNTLVADNLAALQTAALIVLDDQGCWRYGPAAPVLEMLCDQLERVYRERPVAVVNVIASTPDRLQALANAFKIRGDK